MFITDLFENDDMFAGSERVSTQIQQDRHPLHDYLTFDDYDLLMDEMHDAQLHVRNDAELDAYLEQFYHNVGRLPVDELFINIVEDLVHGRHGKYGTVLPRNSEPLLHDLNDAFRRTWTEQKPHTTVYNLTKSMASACLAAINAESDELSEEEDDMFSEPRNELGKYIRGGHWHSAAKQCLKSGIRNIQVEKNIIPGIVRSQPSGSVAGGATWYTLRDWYNQFIAPNDWPELMQYVSSLKAKGAINSALRHLIYFYSENNPRRMSEVYQIIVDKKAVDALIDYIHWNNIDNEDNPINGQIPRVPSLEPYIMTSPRAAMYYADSVLDSRWPDAEPYIATDKVSWSMYSARLLNTDNMTKAGRATRDAAQQEALRRLPAGHKKRIAEDEMFAGTTAGEVLQWYKKLDELCDETGHNADELLRFDSDTWVNLYTNVEDEGYPASVIGIANEQEREQIIQDIKGFIRDIQQESGINEDEMFAQSKRDKYTKMLNEILAYLLSEGGEGVPADAPIRSKLANLQSTLNNQGLRSFMEVIKQETSNLRDLISTMIRARNNVTMAQIEKEVGLAEEDDMFATSDRASKIKAVIIAGHEEFLTQKKIKQTIIDYCRDHELKILGTARDAYLLEIYVRAPAASALIGLVVPLEELAYKQDMNVTMLNGFWDLRTKKPFIAESEDDMFAKTPIEKFVDGLRAYQKTIEQDLSQQHPSWADHPHTVEQRRILTRVQILVDQISNPRTMLQGLTLLASYINSTTGSWTSDIEEFLVDNKYPTIIDMLQRYENNLSEGADPMFSTSVRNVASFDTLFDEIIPGIDDDMKDDFAGYLYDFDTPEAIDMINERIPDNIMINNAYWNDEKEDWVFTFKKR